MKLLTLLKFMFTSFVRFDPFLIKMKETTGHGFAKVSFVFTTNLVWIGGDRCHQLGQGREEEVLGRELQIKGPRFESLPFIFNPVLTMDISRLVNEGRPLTMHRGILLKFEVNFLRKGNF